MINYGRFKDVYHYLQSKSRAYPNIDSFTIREHFVKPMKLTERSHVRIQDIDIIFKKTAKDESSAHTSQQFYLNRS